MHFLFTIMAFAMATGSNAIDQPCYYPNQLPTEDDSPCPSDSGHSACCGKDAICLRSGLCLVSGAVSRGSCTDYTWEASECSQHCKAFNPKGGSLIIPCSATDFACGTYLNCEAAGQRFLMEPVAVNQLNLNSSQLASAMSVAGVSSATTALTASSNATNSPITQAQDRTSERYTAGEMAGVGLGIGVPLLAVIGILTWILFRERKKHGSASAASSTPWEQHGDAQRSVPLNKQFAQREEMGQENEARELDTTR